MIVNAHDQHYAMKRSDCEHRELFTAVHRSLLCVCVCNRSHAVTVEGQCCKKSSSATSVNRYI
eukprot:7660924-Prorocentrum_lima.AAC.1